MYRHVHAALKDGNCIGIFPEGGSHDQTDLLPLKAGVSAIAFGALEKYDVNVRIGPSCPSACLSSPITPHHFIVLYCIVVPVGLNYFRGQGHRFRARVVVEFGAPIRINSELYKVYKEQSRRVAYQALLSQVQDAMRAVVVTARSYDDLKLIHTLRRLYQRASAASTLRDKQNLSRRFSIAHRRILELHNNELPPDLAELRDRLEEYQTLLDDWGIKDYQVNQLQVPFSRLLYAFIHCAIVFLLASIPNLLLNAPVGIAASYWAAGEARKDLKASRVKVKAKVSTAPPLTCSALTSS